jgi:GNAT superfamily N-acetyltransferase
MTTPGLTIRLAGSDDVPQLVDLAVRTFRDAFGHENDPADIELHVAGHYTLERMGAEVADPEHTTLLAEMEGRLAGYAQLDTVPPSLPLGPGGRMLHRFYLDQAWIGRGIALPLMAAVKQDARRRGATFLWLTVWERNARAIAFYHKCGFTVAGSTAFKLGTELQQDWVMTCPI